ncbi:hypothetical protein VPH35_050923 [Triticum aestivum]|uniref:Uncharacterized protein n=2 Tax=Triticum TaxID=4564 RepID=A0A9R1QCP1_TRITD|nr:unnamed protein product [Triticum aestivum]VAH74634.1 unnamed protein product [Triticum turgidum subsp. durum]
MRRSRRLSYRLGVLATSSTVVLYICTWRRGAARSCPPAWRGPVEIGMRAVRCVLGYFGSIRRCPSRWRCLVGRRASRNDQRTGTNKDLLVPPSPWMDIARPPSTSSLGAFAPSLPYRL